MTLPGRHPVDQAYAGSSTSSSTVVAYGTLFLLFVYYMLQLLDFPVLPISELLWNALVYITPVRVITILNPSATFPRDNVELTGQSSSKSIGYARKSEAIRKILGLDGTGMMSNVQRARSISGIGAMIKGTSSTGPPGLGNWDNSCYQNSILQGFAALRSLPDYLSRTTQTGYSNTTTAALGELLIRLNDPKNVGQMYWTPPELKSMSSWQQQDAQEYFSKVLDEVEQESSNFVRATARNRGLAGLSDIALQVPNLEPGGDLEPWRDTKASSEPNLKQKLPDELTSIIARNPLEGLLAQRVGCLRCGYVEGLSVIPFNCLTVSLGRQWMYDIRSCLENYTSLESINGVECAKCTLVHTKQQLEKLLSRIQSQTPEDGEPSTTNTLTGLRDSSQERLAAVITALEGEDFSDNTLLKKCEISTKNRVSTTKTRQAVVARAPESLVIHVNRSVFDELTGAQTKNFADVQFPHNLDFSPWCLGMSSEDKDIEGWNTDPASSMVAPEIEDVPLHRQKGYELRAVVTHYGRHENGHYICYRKYPSPGSEPEELPDKENKTSPWWRLSDDDVSRVSEENVLAQGGVFMLFYEQVDQPGPPTQKEPEAASEQDHNIALGTSLEATSKSDTTEETAKPPLYVENPNQASVNDSSSAHVQTSHTHPENARASIPPTAKPSDPEMPIFEESSSSFPFPDANVKENHRITPPMRTAPPRSGRGSTSRRSKNMGQVSSMVTAN